MKTNFPLFFVLFLVFGFEAQAQTYYWVGGSGNWTDLSKWAATSGGAGGAFVQVPQSFNDVVIDANSGFGANPSGSRIITLPAAANSTCRNLTIAPGAVTNVKISGATRMDVYGNITLSAVLPAQNTWTGNLFLFGNGNHTHQLFNIRLYNANIRVEPTGGNHILHAFNASTILRLEPGAAGSVTFETSIMGGTINHINGTTTFNIPVVGYSAPTRLTTFTAADGIVVANQSFRATTCTLTGGNSDFRAATNLGNFSMSGATTVASFAPVTHEWTTFNALNNQTSQLNIQNTTIIGLQTWYLYFAAFGLNAAGSTLDFNSTTTTHNFVPGGQNYNNVYFRQMVNLRRSNSTAATGLGTGTFNELLFERGLWTLHASTYTINPGGLVRMLNGGMYNGEGSYLYTITPVFTVNVGNNARTQLVGACTNLLYMRRIDFNFGTGTAAHLVSDYVRMEEVNAFGPEAPYQAGAGSHAVPNTVNQNWLSGAVSVNALRPGRYLRWVGPVPADPTNAALYGAWQNPANWANGTLHPAAGPGSGLGGECPPTLYDTVVFPNNSYVRVDSAFIETGSMTWLGAGNFRNQNFANNNAMLEVYGSLQWSAPMSLLYNGVIKLRAWADHHTIRSNGQDHPYKVVVETTTDTGAYRLLDAWSSNANIGDYTFELRRGHFNTDSQFFLSRNFWGSSNALVRRLTLGSSTVHITGGFLGNSQYCFEVNSTADNLTINAGTSHIHILLTGDAHTTNMRITIGTGHHFHKITMYGDRPWIQRINRAGTTSYHEVEFRNGGTMFAYNGERDSIHVLRTHTINPLSAFPFVLSENSTTSSMVVDSALFYGNTNFVRPVDYRQLMRLSAGRNYTIDAAATRRQLIRDGGQLQANGNCDEYIYITGGRFTSNTPQFGNYLFLTNNVAGPAVFTHSNSVESGTVTGWIGGSAPTRVLYWFNRAGATTGEWSDRGNWSLADGYMLDMYGGNNPAIGNCIPTRVDDVYFTSNSFDHPLDSVRVQMFPQVAECRHMYWTTTTPATFQSAAVNEQLHVYGSLQWAAVMNNRFMGDVHFRGSLPGLTIRSNGIAFNRSVLFNGATSAVWTLQDALNVPNVNGSNYSIYLQVGTLNTNSQAVSVNRFTTNYTTTRGLIMGTTQFTITNSGDCLDMRGAGLTFSGNQSHFIMTAAQNTPTSFRAYLANNATYNNFTATAGRPQFIGTSVNINNMVLQNAAFLQLTTSNVRKVQSLATSVGLVFEITAPDNVFDSVVIAGNAAFRTNNRYRQLLQLTPARSYTFNASSIQHLDNAAEFRAVGTGGGGEIFFNSHSTGNRAYIRKDSGIVCVDFIYLRDIWAIGNGLSTQTACASPLCDTAQASSNLPTRPTSGRALFQAGANANDQGNNAGWDFTPYPPVPGLNGPNSSQLLCPDDTLVAYYNVVGQLPINIRYRLTINGVSYIVDSFYIQPLSGNGTAVNPYIWAVTFPLDSTTTTVSIEALSITAERCFNNTAPGSGLKSADITQCLLFSNPSIQNIKGICQDGRVRLTWEVPQKEDDLLGFVVEHSPNGVSFEAVGEVPYDAVSTQFEYLHAQPGSDNYYRLRTLQADGSWAYTPVVYASCEGLPSVATTTVFPNPNDGSFTVGVTGVTGLVEIAVQDALGRLLHTESHNLLGNDQIQPQVQLPAGVYFLSVRQGNWQQLTKVVVR